MTELFEPTGPHDRRLAASATGLLREFNQAGWLSAPDVLVASRVAALAGETDEAAVLALAMAVRAVRQGSTCVDLSTLPALAPDLPWPDPGSWTGRVAASTLVEARIAVVEAGLVYLDRYWREEDTLARILIDRAVASPPDTDEARIEAAALRVFPAEGYAEQRRAASIAAGRWTTVLTGGPGTGKTTAVAGLLALLAEQSVAAGDRPPRIALTAPTGKAAARLGEAVAEATRGLPEEDRERVGELSAVTLHRLLGWRRGRRTRFAHDRHNRLPHDLVVVDESSMVSLTMMTRLMEAMRPEARLVLVGDPDQLSSVEAGAVLADLVAGLGARDADAIVALHRTHRFGQEIADLAVAIRDGDADRVIGLLQAGSAEIEWWPTDTPELLPELRALLVGQAVQVRGAAESGDPAAAVAALDAHRLLCAHRSGPFGVQHWNRTVERWLGDRLGITVGPGYAAPGGPRDWYVGRPLIITSNDYGLGLFNGDTGVVVAAEHGVRAVIAGVGEHRDLATSRLSDVETMHALTIHKSQGSQAREVSVLLPEVGSRMLTRELLYTAVTRAQERVRIIGTEDAIRQAVTRQALRASGLRERLTH